MNEITAPFRYERGDRPLEGYTIEQAVGRGGFGEVYYAVSDAGKQVAIKALQYGQDIELRGISHCMNLKSPHLVTIFDVRQNERGQTFVIMEYVAGPSLRQLIDASPGGLGVAKCAFFLREIAKGLNELHQWGIVHRDLKPHNIFYEDGYVKIGDYSLSKSITASQHSNHTLAVGTVHYMAPEIGLGNYDRGIDIYALGVIVYEMLTGRVPYSGATPGEVLMKHLASEVDVSGIEEPFASVIRRAMTRDPAERFADVAAMVEAVYGSQQVQQSMTGFRPETLTQLGHRAMPRRAAAAPFTPLPGEATPTVGKTVRIDSDGGLYVEKRGRDGSSKRVRIGKEGIHVENQGGDLHHIFEDHAAAERADSIDWPQRRNLALATIAVVAFAVTILSGSAWITAIWLALSLGATAWAIEHRWRKATVFQNTWLARIGVSAAGVAAFYCVGLLVALIVGLNIWHDSTLLVITLGILLADWQRATWPRREDRIMWQQPILLAVLGVVGAAVLRGSPVIAGGFLAGLSLALQVASPYIGRREIKSTDDPSLPAQGNDPTSMPPPELLKAAHFSPAPFRLIALLLALVPFSTIPLFGLHRFYAGKIGTGILWLCTLGLLGIGQLVDTILIAMGQFRDAQGRAITEWLPASSGRESETRSDPAAKPVIRDAASRTHFILNMLAATALGVMLIVALMLAIDLPRAVAADMLAPMVTHRAMQQWLGHPDWPRLAHSLGWLLMIGSGLFGAVVLLLVRTRYGFLSVIRACVGLAVLGIGMLMLPSQNGGVMRQGVMRQNTWPGIAESWRRGDVGVAIETLLNSFNVVLVLLLAVIIVAAMVLILWPTRQRDAMKNGER